MKTLSVLLVLGMLGLVSGCHSGTMRGAGQDVEKLGDRMQN